MNFARRRRKRVMEFQQSAMVDVSLQLLIFFFLTSTFVAQSGINLNIPNTTSKPVMNQSKIILSITRGNQLFINDQPVDDYKQLSSRLTDLLARSSDKKVIVKADQGLELQDVVTAMDVAKQAGALELALATKSDPSAKILNR